MTAARFLLAVALSSFLAAPAAAQVVYSALMRT